jgi:hypothetical protein
VHDAPISTRREKEHLVFESVCRARPAVAEIHPLPGTPGQTFGSAIPAPPMQALNLSVGRFLVRSDNGLKSDWFNGDLVGKSADGRAPRRRETLVEEESTQKVVD